jgi:hypothetical protein
MDPDTQMNLDPKRIWEPDSKFGSGSNPYLDTDPDANPDLTGSGANQKLATSTRFKN